MLNYFVQQIKKSNDYDLLTNSEFLLKKYQELVEQNHIQSDPAQLQVLNYLQNLRDGLLENYHFQNKSRLQKLFLANPTQCKSLYIYGDVGRGKSMLMDMFYESCSIQQKRRVHFHAFMLEVHEFIYQWRHQNAEGDMLVELAKKIRATTILLCFDEFQVKDIADAMILGRLFSKLFSSGLIVVMTSNRHPNALYQEGLQRELFLPFIDLVLDVCITIDLAASKDYRLEHLHALKTRYYYPLDDFADTFIQNSFDELTAFAPIKPGKVWVKGREINISAVHGDVALSSFSELCEQPLGSVGYLEMARVFTTIIIADIPQLSSEKRNEAKRFSTLIDVLYEHKVKLICSAEVAPHLLYVDGDDHFEFQRTVSRLVEMQSEQYLQSQHLCA